MKYNTRKKRHEPSISRRRSIRRRRKTIRKRKGGGFLDKLKEGRSLFSTDRISFYPTKFENNEFTFQFIPETDNITDNNFKILCLSPAIDGYEKNIPTSNTVYPKLKKYSESTFQESVSKTTNITLIIYKESVSNEDIKIPNVCDEKTVKDVIPLTSNSIIDKLYSDKANIALRDTKFTIDQYSQFDENYNTINCTTEMKVPSKPGRTQPIATPNTRFILYDSMKMTDKKTKNGFPNHKYITPTSYIINTKQIPKNVDDFLKGKHIIAPFSIGLPVKDISSFMKELKQKKIFTV